jgi:hypothetical protein
MSLMYDWGSNSTDTARRVIDPKDLRSVVFQWDYDLFLHDWLCIYFV